MMPVLLLMMPSLMMLLLLVMVPMLLMVPLLVMVPPLLMVPLLSNVILLLICSVCVDLTVKDDTVVKINLAVMFMLPLVSG